MSAVSVLDRVRSRYSQSEVDGHDDEIGAVYLPFADLFEIKAN